MIIRVRREPFVRSFVSRFTYRAVRKSSRAHGSLHVTLRRALVGDVTGAASDFKRQLTLVTLTVASRNIRSIARKCTKAPRTSCGVWHSRGDSFDRKRDPVTVEDSDDIARNVRNQTRMLHRENFTPYHTVFCRINSIVLFWSNRHFYCRMLRACSVQ
jgi:hypothetical protein